MNSNIDTQNSAAKKIVDAGSDFKVPKDPPEYVRSLSKEEWMEEYGEVLASEEYFESRDPKWHQNPQSWWYREVGRAGSEAPLWMRTQWHLPELDCPADGDRHELPPDLRSSRPLWAERMGLTGNPPKPQTTTIYGHRREYLPSQKTDARSKYERYQPAYHRVLNDEIPDTSDPPDGRFWTAGIAQGVSTNPYERRLAISGRRKPIVIGPQSIAVIVDGEGHTLANAVRDVAWLQ